MKFKTSPTWLWYSVLSILAMLVVTIVVGAPVWVPIVVGVLWLPQVILLVVTLTGGRREADR